MRTRVKSGSHLHLWLSRLIDDLNPEDFTVREVVDEFGAYAMNGPLNDRTWRDYQSEGYIRANLKRLLEKGFIAKVAKGRFCVTDAGGKFRDAHSGTILDNGDFGSNE